MNRRNFIKSILAASMAPAFIPSGIARGLLMPVKEIITPTDLYLATSTDGVKWVERSITGFNDIVYGNNLFVVFGDAAATDPYILTPPDGVKWTEIRV